MVLFDKNFRANYSDGCFQKKGYPQIIHFNRVFPLETIHFGVPLFLETSIKFQQISPAAPNGSLLTSGGLTENVWVVDTTAPSIIVVAREVRKWLVTKNSGWQFF